MYRTRNSNNVEANNLPAPTLLIVAHNAMPRHSRKAKRSKPRHRQSIYDKWNKMMCSR